MLHEKSRGLPEMVWKHIDLYNVQGSLSNWHDYHEKKGTEHLWNPHHPRRKRKAMSNFVSCARCAGRSAINWLSLGNPKSAIEKVAAYEKAAAEYYPSRQSDRYPLRLREH